MLVNLLVTIWYFTVFSAATEAFLKHYSSMSGGVHSDLIIIVPSSMVLVRLCRDCKCVLLKLMAILSSPEDMDSIVAAGI